MTFANLLKMAMKRKGVTLDEFHFETRIPRTTIQTWMDKDDIRPMITPSLKKAVYFLNITLEELMEVA